MVLPAKLLPAARKSKNISLSNLVIFSTIQILTSPLTVKKGEYNFKNFVLLIKACGFINEKLLNSKKLKAA